jgi:hypothetical protein
MGNVLFCMRALHVLAEGDEMDRQCIACGGQLETGTLGARNTSSVSDLSELLMAVTAFAFIRPGVPTSSNPVRAFVQGLRDEPGEQQLPIVAFRCVKCGRVELYADEV